MKTLRRTSFVVALVLLLSSCDSVDPVFYTFDATVNPPEAGTITPSNGASFEENTTIQLTAQPANLWRFVRWDGDLTANDNPATVTITKDLNITAIFEPIVPLEGLRAYFPFEGNVNDESGNENHGVVVDASLTNDRFGQANSAYDFDGIDDLIMIPHSSSLDFGELNASYSLSFWVKSTSPTQSRLIEKWDELVQTPYPFSLQIEPEVLNGVVYDGSQVDILVVNNLWNGQWHHVVFAFDSATNTLLAYLDGDLVSTQSITISRSTRNASSVYIGGGLDADRYYHGQLDDLLLYGRVLTRDEVLELYQRNGWDGG